MRDKRQSDQTPSESDRSTQPPLDGPLFGKRGKNFARVGYRTRRKDQARHKSARSVENRPDTSERLVAGNAFVTGKFF